VVSRYRRTVHPGSRRAFTAIELMNFLALAAVLSAVGMYALARYVRHTKTVEAVSSVMRLAGGAAEYYDASDGTQPAAASPAAVHAMRHFPPSSTVPVPAEELSVRGHRYQSNLAELHFSMVQPQYYRYTFASDGAGATATATVTAEGDLDGDGIRSTYSLAVTPDQGLAAQVAKTMTKTDGEE
jgi:type II secretory pathway pseudopilin PulG